MLNIVYRLCEERTGTHCGDNRPEWFSKEICLYSFLDSLYECKNLVDNVVFVHDGPLGPLFNIISSLNYQIIKIDKRNYAGSLISAYELVSNLDGDFYFVEDDYLHLPDSIRKIALAVPQFKLISPYDHLSRYDPIKYTGRPDTPYELKLVFDDISNHHWRTNESACHTYAISGDIFKLHYSTITSQFCVLHDQNLFRTMYSLGVPLWTPITGLATQVDPYMSPGIDWESFNRGIKCII